MKPKFPGAECSACPLREFASVPSKPIRDPRFAIVGEGPGFEELLVKEPFVGTAGKLLDKMLTSVGLERRHASVYNATSCYPGSIENKSKKKKALEQAVPACNGRLLAELQDLPLDVPILVLGTPARDALGMKLRDKWEVAKTGHKALTTFHPAAALYLPGMAVHSYAAMYKFANKWPDFPGVPKWEVCDGSKWPRWLDRIHKNDFITLDVETDGALWYAENKLLYLGVSAPRVPGEDPRLVGSNVMLIPPEVLYSPEGKRAVQWLFDTYPGQIGGHNFKYDMNFLSSHMNLQRTTQWWDTMLMSKNINEHWIKGLKPLSVYFFDVENWKANIVDPHLKKAESDKEFDDEINYGLVPTGDLADYLAHDVHYNLLLAYAMREELEASKRYHVPYTSYEVPHAYELHRMEQWGVAIDIDRAHELDHKLELVAVGIEEALVEQSGGQIVNPRSWVQIGKFWYDTLGFPLPNIPGKPARTTCDAAMDKFVGLHPSVATLKKYRRVEKMLSSYVRPVIQFAFQDKYGVWRTHSSYKQAHVTTGRLSAKNPAIQTIPRDDDEYGKMIKDLFIAPPGYVLVAVDGSQWELRVLAAWSEDPRMVKIYQDGGSIHKATANIFFPDGYDHRSYIRVKNFVFSWAYGGKAESSAYVFELPAEHRAALVEKFNREFAVAVTFRDALFEMARTTGQIETPTGHVIHYPVVTNINRRDVEKTAINYPIQGTASQLICIAGFEAGDDLRKIGAYPIIYKHDEIVVETPEDKVDQVARVTKDQIEIAAQGVFPIIPWVAEVEIGERWGSMKGYEL